ncbi:hypothetical protein PoB_003516100 [Plakobranchus ocellatus]|uniref:Uncharacterized protein n=1 Tax=Plakobranchus ocellatus TaxID=259542 RepID=A0AAV4AQ00_9GAST|nr:hypothetical protein PoB_003516100 [Plakobranchus ocellatus]
MDLISKHSSGNGKCRERKTKTRRDDNDDDNDTVNYDVYISAKLELEGEDPLIFFRIDDDDGDDDACNGVGGDLNDICDGAIGRGGDDYGSVVYKDDFDNNNL